MRSGSQEFISDNPTRPIAKASSLHSDITSCTLPVSPGQLTCKALSYYIGMVMHASSPHMQVLDVIIILLASLCISGLPYFSVLLYNSGLPYIGAEAFGVNLRTTSGCIIFISLVEVIFQVVAIIWLFVDVQFLNIKIPLGNTIWYLFTIIVSLNITGIQFAAVQTESPAVVHTETYHSHYASYWIHWALLRGGIVFR